MPFVGLIMLIGIVKKNAIMMIDFALNRQRSDATIPPEQAIYEAAVTRFRPIMMTTMAALMGTPADRAGHRRRGGNPAVRWGLCVAGGLLLSQLLTLYITPVIYSYLDRFSTHMQGRKGAPPRRAPAWRRLSSGPQSPRIITGDAGAKAVVPFPSQP